MCATILVGDIIYRLVKVYLDNYMELTQAEITGLLATRNVIKEGHFLLSSGKHSNRYLQCAQILQYPDDAAKLGSAIATKAKHMGAEVVVSPALGGVIIGHEVARALKVRFIFAERENGKMTLRRGFTLAEGEKVFVVEDVITTGGSAKEVVEACRAAGADVVGVGSIIDRSGSNKNVFDVPFLPLTKVDVESWDASDCPLCKEGASPAIKPGSRNIAK